MDAAKKFSQVLLAEHKTTKIHAPTLHAKIEEFISSQAKVKLSTYTKQLPETIVKDEKIQAQLSGVLVGKAALSPKAFTVWTAIFTILTTAALKSITKSPETYVQVIDERYRPILDDLKDVDWNNSVATSQAAVKFKSVFKDAGIEMTDQEALAILMEVVKNPDKLDKSLRNIDKAFREFKTAIEE